MSRPSTLRLPERATAHRLETARGSFAVLDAAPAPDAPAQGTALLVPGFTGSKEDFLDLLAPLSAAGFRVVAVDGRGQYETPGPRDEAAYAQRELAADVRAQADALAAQAPGAALHVLGHSLGGHLVRAALLAAGPGPFSSVTLMSSGPAEIAPDQQLRTQLLIDHLPTMDMETAWWAMRSLDSADTSTTPVGPAWLDDFLHRRWIGTVPEQLIATARQLMTEPDRVAELAAIPLPKLVLSGEVDYAWPVPLLDAMAERLGARRVVIKGAEHSPNAERPAETAAALVAFWADEGTAAGQAG
jgi:pimeloyl-ACP methyl ester carboxylesterase